MKRLSTFAGVLLAANGLMSGAWASDCVQASDLPSLETAAIQQELMVAALTCHDVGRYNQFVLGHRSELIDSDARLKAFFVRRDGKLGEAHYHSFKTELANKASLRSIRATRSFCAGAQRDFASAGEHASLAAFISGEPDAFDAIYMACPAARATILADASPVLPSHRAALADDEDQAALKSPPAAEPAPPAAPPRAAEPPRDYAQDGHTDTVRDDDAYDAREADEAGDASDARPREVPYWPRGRRAAMRARYEEERAAEDRFYAQREDDARYYRDGPPPGYSEPPPRDSYDDDR